MVFLSPKYPVLIQVLDKTFELFIEREEIQREVTSIADKINRDYAGEEIIFVAVLNGAFMFASDLIKKINVTSEITFVKMSSYSGIQTTGKVEELIGLKNDLEGKNVIVLEDIVDSGLTMDKIIGEIVDQSPKTLKICTLLFKPDAFKGNHSPHYVGFSIPNAFVVGYGLDYDEKGRNLDAIYQIKE